MSNTPTLIAHLSDISGFRFTATLLSDAAGYTPYVSNGVEETAVGQIGSHLVIKGKGMQLLTQVLRTWEEPGAEGEKQRLMHLIPIGDISHDGRFTRGVSQYPVLGAEVHLVSSSQLEGMFDAFRRDGLHLGRQSQRQELKVYFDPSRLFGRHVAILGQSGSGKSWTVASILQRTVKVMPKAHVILLDMHGEYGWHDTEGNLHSAFPVDMVNHIDARQLEIPYWLLTYAELVDLLIDPSDANASLQVSFLRDTLFNLRRKGNRDLGIDRLSVDSPVYFSIKELYMQFKKANEHVLDFGKTRGPLFGAFDEFLVRFQALFNDSRYDFLFKPRKRRESKDLEALLRDFVGLGKEKRPINVIDLSGVPHDVRPTISAQIARLALEFNYWNPQRREFPILLVCEEAHQYIPREQDKRHAATRKEIERIAKEGRKYGVGLCVVSQRPLELSETVLSQCASYICLRISNPDDQEYVRQLMPEGEQDLAEMLASLRRGEALAVGEAIPLPTRFQVYKPEPQPDSADVPVATSWRVGPDDLDVADIVQHWWKQKR
jgi:DNA helicase HerA-like ATPase